MPRSKRRSASGYSQINILFRAVLAIALFASQAIAQEAWKAVDPSGIHYAVPRQFLHPDQWKDALLHTYDCTAPCVVALDDRMSGLHLRYKWAQLNPRAGVYDFAALGQVLDTLKAAGKFATLTVMAGKYTPEWVLDAGSGHIGLPARSFDGYSQPFVPHPWHPVFLAAYEDMLEALAAFLRQTPDRNRTVVAVRNAAVVVHSGETRLMPTAPFEFDAGVDRLTADRIKATLCAEWAKAGYTEDKVVDAVRRVNDFLAAVFPDKYITLGFVGGSRRFPTVGKKGQCRPGARNGTMDEIIRQTVSDHGPRAIIVNTVLTPKIGNPPVMDWVRKNGGQIGYQVNQQIVGCAEGAKTACSDTLLRDTLQVAVDLGAVFVEVHDGNINRQQDILREFNAVLTGR